MRNSFFNKGISTPGLIIAILLLIVVFIGGYFAWQYFNKPSIKNVSVTKIPIESLSPTEAQKTYLTTKKLATICEGCKLNEAILSPDGQHFAYTVIKSNGKWSVFLDGKKVKEYNTPPSPHIYSLTFSPDSKHFAYIAKRDEKYFVVLDGKEEREYDLINPFSLTFSPNSKHLAYAAKRNGQFFVVLDGKEGERYDTIGSLTFSPNSKHLAYAAKRNGDYFVVIDGKEEKYEWIDSFSLIFSPDSKRFAYVVGRNDQYFVVLDGKEGEKYDEVFQLTFSPDSKHLAYIAERENRYFFVLDGKEGEKYDTIFGQPRFTQDSQYIYYAALKGNEIWRIIQKVK